MSQKPLVTISGPPASGTTTFSQRFVKQTGFENINGGDIFRNMAEERGLTLSELSEKSEEDDSIDKELDARIKEIIDNYLNDDFSVDGSGLLIESRLAGWHADGRADLAVYLYADEQIRVDRIQERDESIEELRAREKSEAKRYMNYYGIDINDRSVYDLCIDTGEYSRKGMVDLALKELKDIRPDLF